MAAVGLIPDVYEGYPHDSSPQMGPVGHIIARGVANGRYQLYSAIKKHEPFGFYREKKIKVDKAIGKQVAKSGQATEDSAGGTYRGRINAVLFGNRITSCWSGGYIFNASTKGAFSKYNTPRCKKAAPKPQAI